VGGDRAVRGDQADRAGPGRGPGWGAACGLLLAAIAVTQAGGFAGGFQFDDWNVIVLDPRVQGLGAWWRSMPGIRPLLKLSYAANLESGLGLLGFHAVNVAIHAGAALLAMVLLSRPEARAIATATPTPTWAALLGALVFALHPVQTEAVTYLSGRSTALAGLLSLGCLVAWLEGRARGRAWLVHGLSPLLLAAALGVKETALVAPLVLLLLGAADPSGARAALRQFSVHALVLVAGLSAFAASPVYRGMASHSLSLRPAWENVQVHLAGLAWLLGQAVRLDRLCADPGLAPAASPLVALLTAAGLAAAAVFGLATWRRPTGLALLWLLLWLPLSGWLLPRPEPANDRQLYLALLGPAWLLGRALEAGLLAGGRRRAVAVAAAGLLLALLGLATVARQRVYRDEAAFWSDVAAKAPGNARAFNNLGLALSAACRLAEADAAFSEALRLEPGHPRARVNRWLLRQGEPPGERPGPPTSCPAPAAQRPARQE
jgi:hypothetical protein